MIIDSYGGEQKGKLHQGVRENKTINKDCQNANFEFFLLKRNEKF